MPSEIKKTIIMVSAGWWTLFDLLHNTTGVFCFSNDFSPELTLKSYLSSSLFRDFGKTVFRGVLFSWFHQAIMKKGIRFCDWSVLDVILFFKRLNFLKYRDKMKQEKRKLTVFTTEDTVKKCNLPVNQLIICRYLCIYCSCFIFFLCDFNFLYGY